MNKITGTGNKNLGPELLKLGYIPKPDEDVWGCGWHEKCNKPAAVRAFSGPVRFSQELIDDFIQDRGAYASVFVLSLDPADSIRRYRLFPSEEERDEFVAQLTEQIEVFRAIKAGAGESTP
jgi:hypothetical protein